MKYAIPEMEILHFDAMDIVCGSPGDDLEDGGNGGTGGAGGTIGGGGAEEW